MDRHTGQQQIGGALATAVMSFALVLLIVPTALAKQEGHHHHSQVAHGKRQNHAHLKQRGMYWGAWIGDQLTGDQPPWDMSAVSRFEELVGKGLSLIEFSAPFAECGPASCAPYRFPAAEMTTIRNYGAIPFFSWGSQSTPVPLDLNEPDFQLADIVAGVHDAYIREFAEGAREWGHPFFLRFDWEMNGDWFSWSEGTNGNEAGSFVTAWRHVHDIFTSVGATNATWVWCPYADAPHRFPPMKRYYPGHTYVDWTCLDGFNWAKNGVNSQPWRSFDEIFKTSYREVVRKIAPGKPMVLAEIASGGASRAKATWIRRMFQGFRTTYRRIRGLIWFDKVDRGVQWPIENSAATTRAFARGVRPRTFKANDYAGLNGDRVLPPPR